MSVIPYRKEIDGLRAIAVVGVVAYHINEKWLPGGFLGVDIFFVISGYLITSIISKQIREGTFSLREFWTRRVRRLYPALVVMLGVVTIIANFVLISPQRQAVGLQSIAALFACSNVFLWHTTAGYWAGSAQDIPILHTWSLSLEEQYYLFLPVLLLVFSRCGSGRIRGLFYILTGLSLGACLLLTTRYQNAAFYLLPTRMWELLIGSMLSVLPAEHLFKLNASQRAIGAAVGLSAIVVSLSLFSFSSSFPGVIPIVPCLGAALVLMCASPADIVGRFLSMPGVCYIGRISYSLYLWHWPVLVFQRHLTSQGSWLFSVVLMAILAAVSYHLVEVPLRADRARSRRMLPLLTVSVVIGIILLNVFPKNRWIPEEVSKLESELSLTQGREFEAIEAIRRGKSGILVGENSGDVSIVVLGSSHARVLSPAIASWAREANVNTLFMGCSGVGISMGQPNRERSDAHIINRRRLEIIGEVSPRVTVVAGRWVDELVDDESGRRIVEVIDQLAQASGTVVVLSQVPTIDLPSEHRKNFRRYVLARARDGLPERFSPVNNVQKVNDILRRLISGLVRQNVSYIDLHGALIKEDGSVRVTERGEFLYYDHHHLNDAGANYVFKTVLGPIVEELISR